MLLLDPAPHDPRPLRLARGPPARRATPAVSGSPTGLTPAGRVAPSCRPQGSCQREGCPRPGWPQEDRREPPTPVGTAWPWLEAPNGRSAGPGPEARHRRTTCCSEMGSAPRPHPGLHVGTPGPGDPWGPWAHAALRRPGAVTAGHSGRLGGGPGAGRAGAAWACSGAGSARRGQVPPRPQESPRSPWRPGAPWLSRPRLQRQQPPRAPRTATGAELGVACLWSPRGCF